MELYIDDYLNGEGSVCREKRQYTAMLYSILCGTSKVKLSLPTFENKNYEVYRAFYEPAFFFFFWSALDDKAAFNKSLVKFANDKVAEIIKLSGKKRGKMNPPDIRAERIDLERAAEISGGEDIYNLNADIEKAGAAADLAKHINGWGKEERSYRNPVAKWMMNIKPDVALLLKRKGVKRGEYRLHFVDMEYLAGPESYPALVGSVDKAGVTKDIYRITLSKRVICDYVLEFLCQSLMAREGEEQAVTCSAGFTSVSVFVGERNKDAEGIPLSKLCEHAKKMYLGEKVKESKLLLGDQLSLTI